MTRFMMTMDDALDLVIEALSVENGDLFVKKLLWPINACRVFKKYI